ncbi:hypothetical protein DHEL01_v202260 [Diaporthe helianthi]|uniref:Uncharacterized protein n=1 Tax=Diaporthe helianthi TaxID=158607 RepID=A0A2P5IA29_DIAHE|nr:hypothetical protein DHEL01_v202260 [Diaporthe helianthi]
MANSDLQNSYGPEMASNGHDLPQAVAGDGLEAIPPGHQHVIAPPYNDQYAKDNQYNPAAATPPHDTGPKRRVAGLPVVAFWGIIVALVLILAIGLGVGLGPGRKSCHNVCRVINAFEYDGEYYASEHVQYVPMDAPQENCELRLVDVW